MASRTGWRSCPGQMDQKGLEEEQEQPRAGKRGRREAREQDGMAGKE